MVIVGCLGSLRSRQLCSVLGLQRSSDVGITNAGRGLQANCDTQALEYICDLRRPRAVRMAQRNVNVNVNVWDMYPSPNGSGWLPLPRFGKALT
jgi:hypothetical protein